MTLFLAADLWPAAAAAKTGEAAQLEPVATRTPCQSRTPGAESKESCGHRRERGDRHRERSGEKERKNGFASKRRTHASIFNDCERTRGRNRALSSSALTTGQLSSALSACFSCTSLTAALLLSSSCCSTDPSSLTPSEGRRQATEWRGRANRIKLHASGTWHANLHKNDASPGKNSHESRGRSSAHFVSVSCGGGGGGGRISSSNSSTKNRNRNRTPFPAAHTTRTQSPLSYDDGLRQG